MLGKVFILSFVCILSGSCKYCCMCVSTRPYLNENVAMMIALHYLPCCTPTYYEYEIISATNQHLSHFDAQLYLIFNIKSDYQPPIICSGKHQTWWRCLFSFLRIIGRMGGLFFIFIDISVLVLKMTIFWRFTYFEVLCDYTTT